MEAQPLEDHMDIAITGASGLVGSAVATSLRAAGHNPIPVVRDDRDGIRWDIEGQTIDTGSLEGIDAVIHLAGEGIANKRWTAQQKARILESRTRGTELISSALAGLQRPPRVLISGSAIGFYGDRGDEELSEGSDRGRGFLSDVCVAWESSTAAAEAAGIVVSHLRTGIVLSTRGGVLAKLLPLYRLALGGRLGSGRQWMSWISIDDEVGAIEWLIDNPTSGPVNLTAPAPVTNRDFNATLARVVGRPAVIPVPSLGPKLLLGGELADELLFGSARVLPSRLAEGGFDFVHPTLESALEAQIRG
jgi:uncharacterized protein (TIGR01777 family)